MTELTRIDRETEPFFALVCERFAHRLGPTRWKTSARAWRRA
jgi:hypothetical protein